MTEHVKVYGVKPRIQYTADGSLTTYEFPFAIFKSDDIETYFGATKQASNTYTVSGAGNSDGGSVTFNEAPVSGTIITIVRNLSIERTSDFQEGSSLRAKVLNDELDYQIACQQQIAENLNRSMVLPPYAADSNLDLTLPMPSAGKAIVWNSTGTNLENSEVEINSIFHELDTKVSTATTQAGIATAAAETATIQAGIATNQAGIATTKANEATAAINHLNSIRTNCITEIPQGVKLELSSGVLTLKAGSKAYIPNGLAEDGTTPKFDIVTTDSDIVAPTYTSAATRFILYSSNDVFTRSSTYCYSGTTSDMSAISNPPNYYLFYNITTNKMYSGTGSGWEEINASLPLGVVKNNSSGNYTSLELTFNGFGYMGSTVFVLPGLKGLAPNGRNPDGLLNNAAITTTQIKLKTYTTESQKSIWFNLQSDHIDGLLNGYFDTTNNYLIKTSDGSKQIGFIFATANLVSGKIENWQPQKTFHISDYEDGCLFPDYNRNINITSSVSSGYTASQSCYIIIHCDKQATQSSTAKLSINQVEYSVAQTSANNQWKEQAFFAIPLSKGDTLAINSTNATWTFIECPMRG